jgi:protein-L-isoaspartate(D-aspartate) O-methyltransferase
MIEDFASLREALAESVSGSSGPLVAGALRSVPRHLFLPGVPPEKAYSDEAIVTKRGPDGLPVSSSSQPALMATMLDQLALVPGHRVLEIGAGTGYNAALIRHIVGPSGNVVSIDIDQDTVEAAREHLAAAGYPDITVLCRDGAEGAAEHAPFDRLIATVGLSDVSPAWLAQLAPDARMVVPIDLRGPMLSAAFERAGEGGHWVSRSVQPCGFIKVRGALAGSAQQVQLAEGVTLNLPEQRDIDRTRLVRAMSGGACVMIPTNVAAEEPVVLWGLHPWLCGSEPLACEVMEQQPIRVLVRAPLVGKGASFSFGLVSGGSIALLTVPEADGLAAAGYGADGAALAGTLADATRAWDAAGQPGSAGLHVDAYPPGAEVPPAAGMVIDRPSTRFVIYRA